MNILEAIENRHSVRQYRDLPLEAETVELLERKIAELNGKSGLHIQLVKNEPKAFQSFLAHYGRFRGVSNYFAMVGPAGADLDERCGYYGEELVLYAQMLGLNTCWVKLTYRKVPGAFTVNAGEQLAIVIAVGYGETQGAAHRSKTAGQVSRSEGETPDWFRAGVRAALLAPTAVNQQKFLFTCSGNRVRAEAPRGACTNIDLGIVKYHFEAAAGRENFEWA